MTKGHAAAPQWSGASGPAGVGLEHCKRTIEIPQELGRVLLFCSSAYPGWRHRVTNSRPWRFTRPTRSEHNEWHRGIAKQKETKCGEMAVGCRSALIVPLKVGNSPWRTQWRKAKRRPADSIEGNMPNTSRFTCMSTSLGWIASGTMRMANLLVEEPGCVNVRTSGSVGALGEQSPRATRPCASLLDRFNAVSSDSLTVFLGSLQRRGGVDQRRTGRWSKQRGEDSALCSNAYKPLSSTMRLK